MTRGRPRRLLAATALALLAASAAGGDANAAVKPAAGTYQAEPAKPKGIYQLGAFAVTRDGGKRRIVSAEGYQGILYPDAGRCDDYEVPLVTESIPITRKGRFSVRERTPVRKGSIRVVWKGRWTRPRRVKGTLRISYRRCDSKIAWIGKRARLVLRP